MADREVKQWITVNGRRVPIFEGESKEEAVKRSVGQSKKDIDKDNDDKEKQIAQHKAEADKLNTNQSYSKSDKLVSNHLKNITWQKAVGSEGQAETSREPVKGISIDKFCKIASKLDSKYDYDYTQETEKRMGMTVNHYIIIRDKK